MAKALSREAILASLKDIRSTPLEVPELGGTIHLRPLTLGAMSILSQETDENDRSRNAVALMIECVCDESGARLFKAEDREYILDMPGSAVTRIVEAITSRAQEISNKDVAGN